MKKLDKTLQPCMCDVGDENARGFVKVEFDGDRLSITGVVGPMWNGNCKGSCGQCVEEIRAGEPVKGWTRKMLDQLCDVWDRWHLNDMRPCCEHQRELGWLEQAGETIDQYHWCLSDKMLKHVKDRVFQDVLDGRTPNLSAEERTAVQSPRWVVTPTNEPPEPKAFYVPGIKPFERVRRGNAWYQGSTLGENDPRGLLGKPCPVCGYRYGSAWQKEDVPQNVLDWLAGLPNATAKPAWI